MTSLLGLMIFFLVITLLVLAGLVIFLWRRFARGGEVKSSPASSARKEE